MSMTDAVRTVALIVWVIVILSGLIAWAFFGRAPDELGPLVAWVSAAMAVGEASNVGKRATWKTEANDAGD